MPQKLIRKNLKENNIYSRIRQILESARSNIARAVNCEMVQAYWLIGKEIVEEEQKGKRRAEYGEAMIEDLSDRLVREYGNGWSTSHLWHVRQFYLTFQDRCLKIPHTSCAESDFLHTLRPELAWSHYRILMRIEKPEARSFYEIECVKNNWSVRELERQKGSLLFERLSLSKDKKGLLKLARKGQELQTYTDMIKDPYVLEFTGLTPQSKLYESKLEQALIDNLSRFLLELGKGFTFVARQKRITLDGEHYFIDLVFYNTLLRCYVLIDLKIGRLTHQDIGQMQMYVHYYDRELKQKSDDQIFASKYKLYLPSEKELQAELKKEKELFETRKRL